MIEKHKRKALNTSIPEDLMKVTIIEKSSLFRSGYLVSFKDSRKVLLCHF